MFSRAHPRRFGLPDTDTSEPGFDSLAGSHTAQEELAQRVGRSQLWVSKCEFGERRVDLVKLEDLALALRRFLVWFATLGEDSVDS